MYVSCLYTVQLVSMAIFFLIVFSINFGISNPSNKQTFAKLDFEKRFRRTYLKKEMQKCSEGGVGVMSRKIVVL